MIPKDCKRLIEVDFPIAAVSKHSAREKSIRHGHPSTLHLWWARRPLAACRAVLLCLLLPDPCDPRCPREFKEKAKKELELMLAYPKDDAELRKALLRYIGDFANWDNANDPMYTRIGRELVKAAHPEEPPLVVDPFAGGGSIPLEALRLGCETFASDLNPVACMILKVMLEDIPREGPKLAEDLRKSGASINAQAESELLEFYPRDPDGSLPIAYLWARTVRCEAPECGAEIPIYRTPWLSKRGVNKARFFQESPNGRCVVLLTQKNHPGEEATFRIANGNGSETPKSGFVEIFGTKVKGNTTKVRCPSCGKLLNGDRVKSQLKSQKGGGDVIFDDNGNRVTGSRLLAVVTKSPDKRGSAFRLPTISDYRPVFMVQKELSRSSRYKWANGLSAAPDEMLPYPPGLSKQTAGAYFNFMPLRLYGYDIWGELFTARQKIAIITLGKHANKIENEHVRNAMFIAISRAIPQWTNLSWWQGSGHFVVSLFGRQALPMVWDYVEASPWTDSSGSFLGAVDWVSRVSEMWVKGSSKAQVQLADATKSPLPHSSTSVWFTDPPYYDAVPYSYLSDLFFVWLKRFCPSNQFMHDPYDTRNLLTPKSNEIIDTLELLRGVSKEKASQLGLNVKDKKFYEELMSKAFKEGRSILTEDGIGCVVFAHKTTEGWEALLSGIVKGNWTITSSWPIATERPGRLRSLDSATLSTSVHLVCRPRPDKAPVGEWADVLRELPKRVGNWMERLQSEGVRGADLVFACIGPALEIYSRYSGVETAEGRVVELDEYLGKIWETVGRIALQNLLGTAESHARNGAVGALEEDARLTALFLWTLQSSATNDVKAVEEADDDSSNEDEEVDAEKKKGGYSLIFDVVRRFSQPLGIDLPKWESRIIETEKGVVRLLPVHERAKQLFGEEGAQAMADRIEDRQRGPVQMKLYPDEGAKPPEIKGRTRGRKDKTYVSDEALKGRHEATTLDKVHAAMLLQDSGRANALRALVEAEQQRGSEFMRLANALSALYPPKSEEKRLLDAMILSAPR